MSCDGWLGLWVVVAVVISPARKGKVLGNK